MTPLRTHVRRTLVLAAAAAVATALAGSAAAAAPAGEIRHAASPNAIAGSYLVTLADAAVGASAGAARTAAVTDRAASLARQYGGAVEQVYDAAINGFEVRMSAAAARRLAAHSAVTRVEQNQTVSLAATQLNPPSWGLDRIDQRNLPLNRSYTYPNTAPRVTAYIIDTGIRYDHTDFAPRAVPGFDAFGGNGSDCNGHGTHVAGTVGGTKFGVAKQVRLVSVRVLNCSGSGTIAGVVGGVNWVTANAATLSVANMSLGGGASSTLDSAVANSIAVGGVTYAVAAGNSNADACNFSPARVPAALTVGATDITDTRAYYSNYGRCLDLFAPGSAITSAWHTSNSATNTISGTSMAAPHVAGVAAMVLYTYPTYTPAQVASYIIRTATPNVVINPGPGSPNRLLYVVNPSVISPTPGPTLSPVPHPSLTPLSAPR
ncbi:S8 family peptidase [Solwaraspora sp. WMMD406]|uniref:S8 family peptidase n=1 Tax=Solwaraspora sp. WMMD406 TaxID=3016095 RepID=UPI0024176889|nr:S8 family peptidase [Solwaraspora sp. WMMD406]MDG4765371.1 S8 family peptidase [Solwaraspora sp. WMMD406]